MVITVKSVVCIYLFNRHVDNREYIYIKRLTSSRLCGSSSFRKLKITSCRVSKARYKALSVDFTAVCGIAPKIRFIIFCICTASVFFGTNCCLVLMCYCKGFIKKALILNGKSVFLGVLIKCDCYTFYYLVFIVYHFKVCSISCAVKLLGIWEGGIFFD